MARKKGRRGGNAPNSGDEVAEAATVVDEVPTEDAIELDFDQTASDRILSTCASLDSLAATAVEEATYAATPFLSFSQRSRIRALATRFDSAPGGAAALLHSAAIRPVETAVVSGGGLSREEIDAIVTHRVEIAVTELLQKLGVAPDSTLSEQMERTLQAEMGGQEQRLLDWMKRHLTESLEMLESTLDDRIADFLEVDTAGSAAEVEAQLEEARENLLKNIDEVRTVEGAFDMDFAAGIVELDRTTGSHDSAALEEAIEAGGGEEDEIEIAGGEEEDEIEIAVGDEEDEIEIAAGEEEDEIELAGDDEGDVIEIAGGDSEVLELELEGEDTPVEMELDDLVEVTASDDASIELELADDDTATNKVTAAEDDLEISVDSSGQVEGTEIALDDEDEDEDDLDSIDLETVAEMEAPEEQEDLEEISVVQAMPSVAVSDTDEIDEAALAEAMEVELEEDDVSLMTLGEGPDEIRIEDIRAELEAEAAAEAEVEVEIDDDDSVEPEVSAEEEAAATGDDKLAIVAKYMDKAGQMNARRQFTPAMELYSKVLDLDKSNFDARISRGLIYSETKDYKKATEDFRAAQAIAPERAGSYYGLAELHYNRRQFNKAIKNYSQALKYDDKLAEAWCRRGLSYYYQKNYKKAYLDLFRAYDINPNLPKIKNFLKLVRNKLEETGG